MVELATATQAYNAGSATVGRFESLRAQGRSETEAAGEIAGGIGGGAACVAAGAAVAAPMCVSLGATLGRAIGGLFGVGGDDTPNYRPAICASVKRALDDLWQDAAANGVSIPRKQLVAWFADGANRATIARRNKSVPNVNDRVALLGDMAASGIVNVRLGGYGIRDARTLRALGRRGGYPMSLSAGELSVYRAYVAWLPWDPDPRDEARTCLLVDVANWRPIAQEASIGLATVAARIASAAAVRAELGVNAVTIRDGRVVSGSGGAATAWSLAALAAAAGGFWWWKRRRRKSP